LGGLWREDLLYDEGTLYGRMTVTDRRRGNADVRIGLTLSMTCRYWFVVGRSL
jgi:hypothetical protein